VRGTFTDVSVTTGVRLSNLLVDFEEAGTSHLGLTIMRTHVSAAYGPGAETGVLHIGLIVGSTADIPVTGSAPTLDPVIHDELPWLYNSDVFPTFSGPTPDDGRPFQLDVRSRRRLAQPQSRYFLVVKSDAAAGAPDTFQWCVRTLVALP
jgi:hypothetical protein